MAGRCGPDDGWVVRVFATGSGAGWSGEKLIRLPHTLVANRKRHTARVQSQPVTRHCLPSAFPIWEPIESEEALRAESGEDHW